MRPVKPGELPQPLSIWRWRESPTNYFVLGIELHDDNMYHLIGINLRDGKVYKDSIWSTRAYSGMGAVLDGWNCLEEAPDETTDWKWQQYLDDIADSDGQPPPAGLR